MPHQPSNTSQSTTPKPTAKEAGNVAGKEAMGGGHDGNGEDSQGKETGGGRARTGEDGDEKGGDGKGGDEKGGDEKGGDEKGGDGKGGDGKGGDGKGGDEKGGDGKGGDEKGGDGKGGDEKGEEDGDEDEQIDAQKVSEEEVKMIMKKMGTIAHQDTTEQIKLKATISYNRINILDTQNTFVNPYNDRKLQPKQAIRLKNEFKNTTIKPFSPENHFIIIIPKDELDPACINTELRKIHEAPFLARKPNFGIKPWKNTGGNHRRKAAKILVSETDKDIKHGKAKIKDLEGQMKEASSTEELVKLRGRVLDLQAEVEQLEQSKAVTPIWGVTVLDEALVPHEIALDLSRNIRTYMYAEGEAEKLTMALKVFFPREDESEIDVMDEAQEELTTKEKGKKGKGKKQEKTKEEEKSNDPRKALLKDGRVRTIFTAEQNHGVLKEIARSTSSYQLGNILNLNYLIQAFGGHTGKLIASVGGLTGRYLSHLFTDKHLIADQKGIAKLARQKRRTDEEQKRLEESVAKAWDALDDVKPDKSLVALMSPELVNAIDVVNAKMFPSTLFTYGTSLPAYRNGLAEYASDISNAITNTLKKEVSDLEKDVHTRWLSCSDDFQDKLDVLYTPNSRQSLRLPILTPTCLRALVDTVSPLTAAVTEMSGWCSPTSTWFSLSTGNKDAPRGCIAYFIKDFSTPDISPIRQDKHEEFSDILCKFFMEHIEKVIEMNHDIHEMGDDWVRPDTIKSKGLSEKFWERHLAKRGFVGTKADVLKAIEETWAAHKETKKKSLTKSQLPVVPGYATLNAPTWNHWSLSMKKNKTRDNNNYAIAALVDKEHISGSRRRLFDRSRAARFLRVRLQGLITSLLPAPTQTTLGKAGKLKKSPKYLFPDGLSVQLQDTDYSSQQEESSDDETDDEGSEDEQEDVDMKPPKSPKPHILETLIEKHQLTADYEDQRAKIQAIITRIVKLPTAGITRDNRLVHPDVAKAVEALITALHDNYNRQLEIEREQDKLGDEAEEEFDFSKWTPPHTFSRPAPHWNLAPFSVYEDIVNPPRQPPVLPKPPSCQDPVEKNQSHDKDKHDPMVIDDDDTARDKNEKTSRDPELSTKGASAVEETDEHSRGKPELTHTVAAPLPENLGDGHNNTNSNANVNKDDTTVLSPLDDSRSQLATPPPASEHTSREPSVRPADSDHLQSPHGGDDNSGAFIVESPPPDPTDQHQTLQSASPTQRRTPKKEPVAGNSVKRSREEDTATSAAPPPKRRTRATAAPVVDPEEGDSTSMAALASAEKFAARNAGAKSKPHRGGKKQ